MPHRATHISLSTALVLSVGLVPMGLAGAAAGAKPVKAANTVTTPTSVTVTPGVGTLTVGWAPSTGSGTITYNVVSSPSGQACSTTKTSCTFPATTMTPWTFSVSASVGTGVAKVTSTGTAPTAAVPDRRLLIVAGQSNAVGAGALFDPVPASTYFQAPYLNGADSHDLLSWSSVVGASEAPPGVGPVALDTPQPCCNTATGAVAPIEVPLFGPEIGLARQIWADTGNPVTIVKSAVGGTSLYKDWNPSNGSWSGTHPGLYGTMINQVKSVMSYDAAHGQLDVIDAAYWIQGETDAETTLWANSYQSNLSRFIADVRSNLPMNAAAPFVLGQENVTESINNASLTAAQKTAQLAGNSAVRAADQWAATYLPNVIMVDTTSLARGPDHLHLTNLSEITLGQELAQASEGSLR